ncbi:MAG: DUF779 domain-containing protein [Aquabacterium sp.]|uniref:DUF779 domain-containing protein n=1 Tax=Aquabacterium sp. TaxID=1872578 RepID=UPI003BE3D7C3
MTMRVQATPAAQSVIEQLQGEHGTLLFYLSHGCCDGSTPMCLKSGELTPTASDVLWGVLAGVPFYMSATQAEYLAATQLTLDVRVGSLGTFSLEEALGCHFVTQSRLMSDAELADLTPVP